MPSPSVVLLDAGRVGIFVWVWDGLGRQSVELLVDLGGVSVKTGKLFVRLLLVFFFLEEHGVSIQSLLQFSGLGIHPV